MKLKYIKITFVLIFSVFLSMNAFADCVDDDGNPVIACVGDGGEIPCPGEDCNCCADAQVPFDGGVSFLIAAGLSVGGYGIFKKKKSAE